MLSLLEDSIMMQRTNLRHCLKHVKNISMVFSLNLSRALYLLQHWPLEVNVRRDRKTNLCEKYTLWSLLWLFPVVAEQCSLICPRCHCTTATAGAKHCVTSYSLHWHTAAIHALIHPSPLPPSFLSSTNPSSLSWNIHTCSVRWWLTAASYQCRLIVTPEAYATAVSASKDTGCSHLADDLES